MTNRWGNNGNSDRLSFFSSKINVDGDCSYEIKRHLLFGRKAMTNLNSVLKSIYTGREVGGEFRMGNMCTHVADSCYMYGKTNTIL